MPLPTYLHLSSHSLFTSININAVLNPYPSPYTHSLTPTISAAHIRLPRPLSPLCRRKRGEGKERQMEKQKPNKRKKQESGIFFNAQSRSKQATTQQPSSVKKSRVVNRTTKISENS